MARQCGGVLHYDSTAHDSVYLFADRLFREKPVQGVEYLLFDFLPFGISYLGGRHTLFRIFLQAYQCFDFQLVRLHGNDTGTDVRGVLLHRRVHIVPVHLGAFYLFSARATKAHHHRHTTGVGRKIPLEQRSPHVALLSVAHRGVPVRHTGAHGVQPYQSERGLLLQQHFFEPTGHKSYVQPVAQFSRSHQIGE